MFSVPACPPTNRGGLFGGAIRIVLFGASVSFGFWFLGEFLLSGCDSPPERLLIAPLYFGGAIRIVVFGASVSFGFCGLMLF